MNGYVTRLVPGLGRTAAERDEARGEAQFLRAEVEAALGQVVELREALAKSRKQVAAHRQVNAELWDELAALPTTPPAEDPDIPSAAPRHLFVMTYAGSGPTMLQAALNSIPGYLIRGDNGGMVPHLFHFHHGALVQKAGLSYRALWPGHPQFGMNDYPDTAALDEIRRLVTGALLRPEPDTRVVGFREVRTDSDSGCLAEYVAFLRELFPGAQFVVDTREVTDQTQALGDVTDRIFEVARALGDDCFPIVYDDYATDPDGLRPLFAWLGEEFDRARLDDVMADRHSQAPD